MKTTLTDYDVKIFDLDEVERAMWIMDDNGNPSVSHIDYDLCNQYVAVETVSDGGRIINWIWAVPNRAEFKAVLKWFCDETKFYGVTAHMKGRKIPTFYSAKTVERDYDYYFGDRG